MLEVRGTVPEHWPGAGGVHSGAKGGEHWLGTVLHPYPHPSPAGICFSIYLLSSPEAARHLDSRRWLLLICN